MVTANGCMFILQVLSSEGGRESHYPNHEREGEREREIEIVCEGDASGEIRACQREGWWREGGMVEGWWREGGCGRRRRGWTKQQDSARQLIGPDR